MSIVNLPSPKTHIHAHSEIKYQLWIPPGFTLKWLFTCDHPFGTVPNLKFFDDMINVHGKISPKMKKKKKDGGSTSY